MYFDVEGERVLLRIRLHDGHRSLETPPQAQHLAETRLALHLLAQRLSLTAGPLRLLDGDFPDRSAMAAVAEHNLKEALELLRDRNPCHTQPKQGKRCSLCEQRRQLR